MKIKFIHEGFSGKLITKNTNLLNYLLCRGFAELIKNYFEVIKNQSTKQYQRKNTQIMFPPYTPRV